MAAETVDRVRAALAAVVGDILRGLSTRSLVVAVSGGADSTCLLDAMVTTARALGVALTVGHVNHHLRPSSHVDAQHVREQCFGYGVECRVTDVDVPRLMRDERRGLEDAARIGRYRALRAMAQDTGAAAVVTGHTRDDAVETVVLHLLRGAGTAGLAGLSSREVLGPSALGEPASDSVPPLTVVRPLLSVSRADTLAYCQVRGLAWREDDSNSDPQFLRNRVRCHLLPVLRTYNPAIDTALERLAVVSRDEDAWLESLARQQLARLAQHGPHGVSFPLAEWQLLPLALRRRLVRLTAADAGYTDVGFAAVERAVTVGTLHGPHRAELGGGLVAVRTGDALTLCTQPRSAEDDA